MKQLKKFMPALAAVGVVMAASVSSQAFTSKKVQTFPATVSVTGGSAAMSVALLNVAGNGTATQITWPAVTPGASWTQASQYLQVTSTLSVAGAGIQTYTDNTQVAASPRYTAKASSTTSAGLVNASNGAQVLPLAWQIAALGNNPVAVDDPNCTGAVTEPASCGSSTGQTGYAWFYYADKAGGLLANAPGNFYIQPENAGGVPQIQFAQSSFGTGALSGINNVYLEANFQSAVGGTSYGTSELTVELFTP